MTGKSTLLLCISAIFLTSCSNEKLYWETSKFSINPKALRDSEKIKPLYVGPATADKDCYMQVIAVSEATGDTVNILTTVDIGGYATEKDKTFRYFNEHNMISKIAEVMPDSLADIKDPEAFNKIKVEKRSRVLRDPKFDDFASNHFPSVIGTIGTETASQ